MNGTFCFPEKETNKTTNVYSTNAVESICHEDYELHSRHKIPLVLLPRHSKLTFCLGTKATNRFVRKTTEDFVTRTTEDFVTKTRNCIPSPKTKLLFCYTYHELPFCLEDCKWFRRQDIKLHPITRNYGYCLAQGPRVGFDT